jgi:hypothetical protein
VTSPNDKAFLSRLTKLRVALHKAKQAAVTERVKDVLAAGSKVIVFTCFTEGLKRHGQTFGTSAVTISGENTLEERMAAVDRFPTDDDVRVVICNLVAGGVGFNLTAATHLPGPRLGSREPPPSEGPGLPGVNESRSSTCSPTLDVYIADLLETKLKLISVVETNEPLDRSLLENLYHRLRALGPALLQENRVASGSAAVLERLEKLAAATPRAPESPLLSGGVQEFRSSRDPRAVYRVTFGRAGHLECTCDGFRWRANCKHVREVREAIK